MRLLGLDHADIRVPSLAAVEAFYDAVMPGLGLSRKTEDRTWDRMANGTPSTRIGRATHVVERVEAVETRLNGVEERVTDLRADVAILRKRRR